MKEKAKELYKKKITAIKKQLKKDKFLLEWRLLFSSLDSVYELMDKIAFRKRVLTIIENAYNKIDPNETIEETRKKWDEKLNIKK